MEKEIEKFCEKYTLHAGRWHKEDCDFIHADAGVCNCDTAKNRRELKQMVATYLSTLTSN